MVEAEVFVNELQYYEELGKFYSVHDRSNKKPWTSEKLNEIYQILSRRDALEAGKRKTNEYYYYSRMYETFELGASRAVIKKRSKLRSKIIYVVPYESFYEKLCETHVATGHGGRDKMLLALKSQYSIPRPAVEIFVRCCTRCSEKRHPITMGMSIRPGFPKGRYYRGHVDLIDLQAMPDGDYTWLMIYEDHRTKFTLLRPLKSNRTDEVSVELLKIFLEFGMPETLQSGNGSDFVDNVVRNMGLRWPVCKVINSQLVQRQGTEERSNRDIADLLKSWLKEHNSTNWSLGCYFVQRIKNSSYHRTVRCTPFEALFGVEFLAGHLAPDLPSGVKVERDCERTFSQPSDKDNPEAYDGFGDTNQITAEIKTESIELQE